jgi:uncharacterized membrane protein
MKSNAEISGHPMHPMLVLLPAGAWITSLVFDIVFQATGNSFWFVAALWTIVVGIAGALVAAVAGMWDLFTLPLSDQPKRVGLTHMTLNLIIVLFYIINVVVVRLPAMDTVTRAGVINSTVAAWSIILNIIAVGILAFSGWLGGDLIYKYAVAVPRETMENAPRYETRVAPGRGTAGALGGESEPHHE